MTSFPRLASLRAVDAAAVVLTAVACVWFAPPLAVDGRFSHFEYALVTLVGATALAVVARRPPRLVIPTPHLALLAWMALSVVWSTSRDATIRDVLTFAVIFFAAVLLVNAFDLAVLALGVALSGALLLLWALALLLFSPEIALTASGALVGPYGNRNGFAYALLTAATAALALRPSSSSARAARWLLIAGLAAAIVATTSRTALLTFVVAIAVTAIIVLARRRSVLLWIVAAALVVAMLAALVFQEFVLSLLGKGPTVNGRLPIWGASWLNVLERPLLGQGWTMAWPVQSPVSGDARWRLDGTTVYHAHNELLNWLVTLGVVGGLLIVGVYVSVIAGGIRWSRSDDPGAPRDWLLIGAAVFVVRGLTDISETLPQGWFVLAILATAAVLLLRSDAPGTRTNLVCVTIPLPQAIEGSVEPAVKGRSRQ